MFKYVEKAASLAVDIRQHYRANLRGKSLITVIKDTLINIAKDTRLCIMENHLCI